MEWINKLLAKLTWLKSIRNEIWLNPTHASHAAIAVAVQLVVWLLVGSIVAGAMVGVAYYFGREHWHMRQLLDRSDLKALDIRKWTRDSQLDLAYPLVATSAVVVMFWLAPWM